jgi:hypothetical protein
MRAATDRFIPINRSTHPAETAMNIVQLLIGFGALVVLACFGLLRPTGLAARTRAEREQDAQRDMVAKWLKKDGE